MLEINNCYFGDCLEVMKSINTASIDMILADLPYGQTSLKWDCEITLDSLWKEYKRVAKPNAAVCLFGQEPFSSYLRLSNIEHYKYDWYWEKERLTNIMQVKKRPGKVIETISVFYKEQPKYNPQMIKHDGVRRTNKIRNGKLGLLLDNNEKRPKEYLDNGVRYPTQILKFNRDILKSNLHPTQKPLALCEYFIKTYTDEGDLVLDNCAGSGTVGLACRNTNRHFILIEKEIEYFNIAKERLNL